MGTTLAPLPLEVVEFDARGYRRADQTKRGFRKGQTPKHKGRKFPADPPTVDEIVAVCQAAPDTPAGRRDRALIILLWRSAMRIGCEALRLLETDLDPARGSLTIRCGKGGYRRVVGMDAWAWTEIQPWRDERHDYPRGELFCVVDGPTRGRAMDHGQARTRFHQLAREAGVRRRFAPHQLRHCWTVEAVREGLPLYIIQRQLGHHDLRVTTRYVAGISNDEVIDAVRDRKAPMMPIPKLMSPTDSLRVRAA